MTSISIIRRPMVSRRIISRTSGRASGMMAVAHIVQALKIKRGTKRAASTTNELSLSIRTTKGEAAVFNTRAHNMSAKQNKSRDNAKGKLLRSKHGKTSTTENSIKNTHSVQKKEMALRKGKACSIVLKGLAFISGRSLKLTRNTNRSKIAYSIVLTVASISSSS